MSKNKHEYKVFLDDDEQKAVQKLSRDKYNSEKAIARYLKFLLKNAIDFSRGNKNKAV